MTTDRRRLRSRPAFAACRGRLQSTIRAQRRVRACRPIERGPLRALILLFTLVALASHSWVLAEEDQVLRPGQPVERTLSSGEVHSFSIALEAGQVLLAVVDQRGIDLVVSVVDPRGTKIAEIDSPNGALGPEPVTIEAKVSGIYRLEVRPLVKDSTGRYEARIEGILTMEQYLLAESTREINRRFTSSTSGNADVRMSAWGYPLESSLHSVQLQWLAGSSQTSSRLSGRNA
jgi:hypothetical protein